jgi:membrane fusion protein (multidrug efflux system)
MENKMEEIKVPPPANKKKKKIAILIFAIIAIIGGISGYLYTQHKKTHITTDDAFIDGHIHTIASKVTGTVKVLYVRDNQPVKKGGVLLEIDPADYEVKVNEALSGVNAEKGKLSEIEARIEVSKSQLSELYAAIDAARANLELQEANLNQAEKDYKRAEDLYKTEVISKERYEKTMTAYTVALAQVKVIREQLKQAAKTIETQKAIVRQAEMSREAQVSAIKEKEAKLNAAQLNYGYTKIYAPSDGYVTKRSVEPGNQIQAGQPLMAIVSLGDIWVTANYKETQLEKVKTGQKVTIKVDTFPSKKFTGKVESIMSGTGAVFSLFPPENATGNYVKVVQRIPVKIMLDKDTDPGHILRIGMSVVPTILIE